MKISKRDANIALIILGVAVFIAGYFLIYNDLLDQAAVVRSEIAALTPRDIELSAHVERIPLYNRGIETFANAAKENLSRFPPRVRTEDLIMYAVGLETKPGMAIASASFSEPWLISEFDAKTEVGQPSAVHYAAYGMTLTISDRLNYDALKQAFDLIALDPERTSLENVSISYDSSTGELTGSMSINKHFVDDGRYVYVPTEVPAGRIGVTSPFGTFRPAPNITP
ncbi:hypothetical protein FACS1894208_03410 [Clostridia bacterium]|nr:hypothetical protein FACS1894208_03410 [Clostridia bacterium]